MFVYDQILIWKFSLQMQAFADDNAAIATIDQWYGKWMKNRNFVSGVLHTTPAHPGRSHRIVIAFGGIDVYAWQWVSLSVSYFSG